MLADSLAVAVPAGNLAVAVPADSPAVAPADSPAERAGLWRGRFRHLAHSMLRHGLGLTCRLLVGLNGLLIGRVHALCHRLHVGLLGLDRALGHILTLLQPADALESLGLWRPWYFGWLRPSLSHRLHIGLLHLHHLLEHLLHHRHLLCTLLLLLVGVHIALLLLILHELLLHLHHLI